MQGRKKNYLTRTLVNVISSPNALNGVNDLVIDRQFTDFARWSDVVAGADFTQFRVIRAKITHHPNVRMEGATYTGSYILAQRSIGEADPANATWTEMVEETIANPRIYKRVDEKGTLSLRIRAKHKQWCDINSVEGDDIYQVLANFVAAGFAASTVGNLVEEITIALR
jgi:hypothetical protein